MSQPQQMHDGTPIIWRPFPGPQTSFLAATEFEVLYGGAKGGMKSESLLMGATRQVHLERYKALVLRETYPELQELMDRSHRVFPRMVGSPAWKGDEKRWVWPNGGGVIQFGYCQTREDVERYHGGEWATINFDEIGNVADEMIWVLLMAECRCPNPAVMLGMRGSANPGKPGHRWLKSRFIDKCGLDGKTIYRYHQKLNDGKSYVLTRRYIPSRVTDNPIYRNDPRYLATLHNLPEMLRRQLLDGDWNAGTGAALDELDYGVHFVKAFEPPPTWPQFAGFDWGFQHPWVFCWCAVDADGTIFVIDTIRGRRHRPDEIAERIRDRVNLSAIRHIAAGHDAFYEIRSRGENTPTIAEQFQQYGIDMVQANTARRMGLNNLRRYLAHRGLPSGTGPRLKFCDTPGNNWLFAQLGTILCDPDDPEDSLKQDADDITGEGGDDGYDCLRYAVASRPFAAESSVPRFSAWTPETLAHEAREGRKVRPAPMLDEDEPDGEW